MFGYGSVTVSGFGVNFVGFQVCLCFTCCFDSVVFVVCYLYIAFMVGLRLCVWCFCDLVVAWRCDLVDDVVFACVLDF